MSDFQPPWLLLVGIAGGFPDDEYSLGDVVVAKILTDFSVRAVSDSGTTTQVAGFLPHKDVDKLLQIMAADIDQRLAKSALLKHPDVYTGTNRAELFYGPEDWRTRTAETIARRFPNGQRQGGPRLHIGGCVNGNLLDKSAALTTEWKSVARDATHVEMELTGGL